MISGRRKSIPIWKSLGYLRGIAILAVVLSHAQYDGIILSNLESAEPHFVRAPWGIPWVGIMPFWTAFHELTRFSVPLFLFLAGHYLAHQPQTIKAFWGRARAILYPFLVWSGVSWIVSWSGEGPGWGVLDFLGRLYHGGTQMGYFFIPLLLKLSFLGIWAVGWVRRKPDFMLVLAGGLHLFFLVCSYALDAQRGILDTSPSRVLQVYLEVFHFSRFGFFFVLGIWAGLFPARLKQFLLGRGAWLLLFLVLSAAVLVLENGFILYLIRASGRSFEAWHYRVALSNMKLSSHVWSLAAILFLLWVSRKNLISWRWAWKLGTVAYLVYFLHGPALTVVNPLIGYLPGILDGEILRFAILLAACIAGPLLFAKVVRTWLPWARTYLLGD